MARRTTTLNPAERERRAQVGERRRVRTRGLLLDAAYQLFALHGAEAPTIDDVILRAGVARGTFYNHFDTRDALFRAVADDIATSINARLDIAMAGMDDPAERLAVAFKLFVGDAVADETRGWILLRTMPLVGGMTAGMKDNVEREFRAAVESGRMRASSTSIAVDLGVGFLLRVIYRMLVERPGPGYIDQGTQAILIALGIEPDEARDIAARPLSFRINAHPLRNANQR